MTRFLLALTGVALLVVLSHAQGRTDLTPMLTFEMAPVTGGAPGGWGGGPTGTIFADVQVVHGGKRSARIERKADNANAFSTMTKAIPMDFTGTRIEMRGFIRTEDVSEFVGLWMREDGDTPGLAFDNMQQRQLKGTNDWAEYSIVLPVRREAKQLFFGVLVAGTGKAWADDLQLLVDGKPISDLDGMAVSRLVADWSPYYAASNEPTRLRDIGRFMLRGDCAKPALLRVRRGNEIVDVAAARLAPTAPDASAGTTHDAPGDTFRLLADDIGYLKLSSIKIADVPRYIAAASKTKGLVIDIRNYPSEFVVFALGSLLVDKPTPFARFTVGDLSNPGAFHFGPALSLMPQSPHYGGKVAILVDEVSQSQAEYTAMAFRSSPRSIVVGSTTAGADGNVSQFAMPGNLSSMISGIGVFYPDKKPTQRIGIIPDVEVKPTIAGIRAGRDEVLEEALRQLRK